MGSTSSKPLLLLLLLLVGVFESQKLAEARTTSFLRQQGVSKTASLFYRSNVAYNQTFSNSALVGDGVLRTLGVICKCCDGSEDECTAKWTGSCHKLRCLPWKLS